MKIFNENKDYSDIFTWSFLCIYAIAYLNLIDETNVWLIPPFGASLVLLWRCMIVLLLVQEMFFLVMFSASSGVMIYYFFGDAPVAIALGLSFAIILMIITNTVHPPAGANPIIAILGAKSFEFVIMPVAIGSILHSNFCFDIQ